jgi:hypothetical protein
VKSPDGKHELVKGMGGTLCIGSDRYSYTVADFSASGKTLSIQEDLTVPAKGFDLYKNQAYDITPDPTSKVETVRWSKKRGRYQHDGHFGFYLGERDHHVDPDF